MQSSSAGLLTRCRGSIRASAGVEVQRRAQRRPRSRAGGGRASRPRRRSRVACRAGPRRRARRRRRTVIRSTVRASSTATSPGIVRWSRTRIGGPSTGSTQRREALVAEGRRGALLLEARTGGRRASAPPRASCGCRRRAGRRARRRRARRGRGPGAPGTPRGPAAAGRRTARARRSAWVSDIVGAPFRFWIPSDIALDPILADDRPPRSPTPSSPSASARCATRWPPRGSTRSTSPARRTSST